MPPRSLLLVTILTLGTSIPPSLAEEPRTGPPAPLPLPPQTPAAYEPKFMQRAIALAEGAKTTPETDPFGAVVVKDGEIVGEGLSAMRAKGDVTAHGEILAIRNANKKLGRLDLSDCVIYASCEPCPMCVAAIAIARLGKVYYATTLAESAKAFAVLPPTGRFGVNVPEIIAEEHATIDTRTRPAQQEMSAQSLAVMESWAKQRAAELAKKSH